jgi:uncharacterized membrane protein
MANNTFTYVGVYDSIAAAEADFEAVKALRQDDLIHVYDMAVVANGPEGKVEIVERSQKSLQHGMEGGALVGLILGELPGAVIGGALGALGGHLRKGFSGDDAKRLGAALQAGQAALVVVGDEPLESNIGSAMTRAAWRVNGTIDTAIEELATATS